jgi:hypothetical protein
MRKKPFGRRQLSWPVAPWLFGHEPLLGGAPIDVLAAPRPGPVLAVLDGVEDGAYA